MGTPSAVVDMQTEAEGTTSLPPPTCLDEPAQAYPTQQALRRDSLLGEDQRLPQSPEAQDLGQSQAPSPTTLAEGAATLSDDVSEHGRSGEGDDEEPRNESGPAAVTVRSDRASIAESGPGPREGEEPPELCNPLTSTQTEPAEPTGEEVICCICIGVATEPSAHLIGCNHVTCLGCYARASIREVGDILQCPLCRATSNISINSNQLRQQHGCDTVSAALRNARSERVLANSTALAAATMQRGSHICEACHNFVITEAAVHMPCGCNFHRRCAVGFIEDRLPAILATRTGTIACAHPVRHGSHIVGALSLLRQVLRVDQTDGEDAERLFNRTGGDTPEPTTTSEVAFGGCQPR